MGLYAEIKKSIGTPALLRVQYTVVDGQGGYFCNIRRLLSFSGEEIVFAGKKGSVLVAGKGLTLAKYYAGDATVRGTIERVERKE